MSAKAALHWSPVTFRCSFSCGKEFAAVFENARLPFVLPDGGGGFFIEQHREREQRERGVPRERGGFVGGAAQGCVQFGGSGLLQFFSKQSGFEPFEFVFLRGAERRGRLESRFRREPDEQLVFLLVHKFIGLDLVDG